MLSLNVHARQATAFDRLRSMSNEEVAEKPGNEPKLRARKLEPAFRVVLVEPEIPQNTGSIARTCAATNTPLHLVGKLGFRIDEHAVRRAGLDYWHLVDVHTHPDLADFQAQYPTSRLHLFAPQATRSYLESTWVPGDALVFGRESVGLPRELVAQHPETTWAIPMSGGVRSLNLSNSVAIVLFEAQRRAGSLLDTFMG